jgi:hypothetical protein
MQKFIEKWMSLMLIEINANIERGITYGRNQNK